MMIIQQLNWLAVLVAALAYFAIGAIWFNPKVFGSAWMKGHNIGQPTEEDKKKMPMMFAGTFVLCFIGAMVTGYFVYALGAMDWMKGAKTGLIASCGFAGVALAMNYMYTRKSTTVILIDSLYHVVSFVVCGVILAIWR